MILITMCRCFPAIFCLADKKYLAQFSASHIIELVSPYFKDAVEAIVFNLLISCCDASRRIRKKVAAS